MKVNTGHIYEYNHDYIVDCFGDRMDSIDEYVDELNMLMDEIRELLITNERLKRERDQAKGKF